MAPSSDRNSIYRSPFQQLYWPKMSAIVWWENDMHILRQNPSLQKNEASATKGFLPSKRGHNSNWHKQFRIAISIQICVWALNSWPIYPELMHNTISLQIMFFRQVDVVFLIGRESAQDASVGIKRGYLLIRTFSSGPVSWSMNPNYLISV